MTTQTSDPICTTCGHPASEHLYPLKSCDRTPLEIYRHALTTAQAEVSRLRCDAQGFHDAAITAGMERDAMVQNACQMAEWARELEVERDELRAKLDAQIANSEALNLVARQREDERDALAQDAARWRYVERNLFVSAPDAEMGEVEVTFQSGILDEIANKMWRDGKIEPTSLRNGVYTTATPVVDAALSTTTEGRNDA